MMMDVRPCVAFEISAGSGKVYNTILSNDASYDATTVGGNGGADVIGFVRSGVQISGANASAGTNSLQVTATGITAGKTKLILSNAGNIDGAGGAAGAGGNGNSLTAGGAGGAASGTALKADTPFDLYNSGNIRQGGGGGGGGGGHATVSGRECQNGCHGGSGGGGAGNGSDAGGGSLDTPCGSGAWGGSGGTWATAGSAGSQATTGCTAAAGGAGGASNGYAIEGYSNVTVKVTGTITGTTS